MRWIQCRLRTASQAFSTASSSSHKRWWAHAHFGSQAFEPLAYLPAVQVVNCQINPSAHFTRGLVLTLDLKDAYFHIHIAPHHRPFLRFEFDRVAYQYAVLSFGLSLALHTFAKVHRSGSFPSETDGSPHIELPQRLADSSQIRMGMTLDSAHVWEWITPERSLTIQ